MSNETQSRRPWPVLLLAAPAFVAIWSGWVGLGGLTGFGMVHPLPGIWDKLTVNSAITLPVGVETYAAYALHIWLTRGVGDRAARFAKWSALGSLVLGAAGQVAYHLMVAAGMTHAPWQITAVVACLPVAVLGMGAALAHLVADIPPAQATDTKTPAAGDAAENAPQASTVVPAPGYQVHPDATVEPVPAIDDVDPVGDEIGEVPAPRPAPRMTKSPVRATTRPSAVSTAVKVARLREKHPDWTLAQIAEKARVSERTVRRHLNTSTTPASTETPPAVEVTTSPEPVPAAEVPADRAA
jgi:hypothetical protein